MASAVNDAIGALADGMRRLTEDMDRFVVMFNRYVEKLERERLAAVLLQAAARGLLARRRVRSLREEAVVRLQAVARGFMVRLTTRKMRAAIRTALSIGCPSSVHTPPPATITPPTAVPSSPPLFAASISSPLLLPISSPRAKSTTADLAKLIHFLTTTSSVLQGRVAALQQEHPAAASFPGSRGSGQGELQGDRPPRFQKLVAGLLPWDPGGRHRVRR